MSQENVVRTVILQNLLSFWKTWCNLCNTGLEFLGHSCCSWIFSSDPASILQYKRFKRTSWKVITILLIYLLHPGSWLWLYAKSWFFPCRCLKARKALLPSDHIQVCCSDKDFSSSHSIQISNPTKVYCKKLMHIQRYCSYCIYACDEYAGYTSFTRVKIKPWYFLFSTMVRLVQTYFI